MATARTPSSNQAIRRGGRRKRTTAVARGWRHQLNLTRGHGQYPLTMITAKSCQKGWQMHSTFVLHHKYLSYSSLHCYCFYHGRFLFIQNWLPGNGSHCNSTRFRKMLNPGVGTQRNLLAWGRQSKVECSHSPSIQDWVTGYITTEGLQLSLTMYWGMNTFSLTFIEPI